MDRRGDPETAEQHRDEQLQKALDLVLESYKGGPPEKLYRGAIGCFEGLMEISQSTDDIQDFARRRGIDLKYLVDGANFVISRMHFNAGNNFYTTLGLPGNAHPDEIRERWKRLMLLYHPDRQTGAEDWVSERAKKVNEAYSVLKDEQKRAAFDRELAGMALRHELQDIPRKVSRVRPSRPSAGVGQADEGPFFALRKYFTKILVLFYLLCFLGVAGFFLYQKNAPDLESQLRPDQMTSRVTEDAGTSPGQPESTRPLAFADARPGSAAPESGVLPGAEGSAVRKQEIRRRDATYAPAGGSRPLPSDTGKEQAAKTVPVTPKTDDPPPASQEPAGKKQASASPVSLLKHVVPVAAAPVQARPPEIPEPEPKREVLTKAVPALQAGRPEERTPAPERTDSRPPAEARPQPTAGQKTGSITREEIDEFMKRYVRAYEKSDLDGIMTLFSHSAVENNLLRYEDILKAYRMAFDGKINYYQLKDVEVKIDGPAALVSGVYGINRYTAAEDRWSKFNGRIYWRIVREQNSLKIISLNYDK